MAARAIGHFSGEVFEGCISADNTTSSKRPYHKYCSCALHKSSSQPAVPGPDTGCKKCKISYPLRPSNWRKGSLDVVASSLSHFSENHREVERKKNVELILQSFGLR